MDEFELKIKLGRKLKIFVYKHIFNVIWLEKDMKDSLVIYE